MRFLRFFFCLAIAWATPLTAATANRTVEVAFGHCDITPSLDPDRPVWMAGYAPGRRATAVHDPLLARCVVLKDNDDKLALVSVDLIGLQLIAVERVRKQLAEFKYVMVSSTHNHEGPDVIGVWGKSFFHRGVDEDYVASLIDKIVQLVRSVESKVQPAVAAYGIAADDSLIADSRQPDVKDGVLRLLRFKEVESKRDLGILVQWNCHPEALGSRNHKLTADFPATTVRRLESRWGVPVAYFSGTLGGLMAPPSGTMRNDEGQPLKTGDFAFAERYGEAVAELASEAMARTEPVDLTPFQVSARNILVPVENAWYRAARALGVLRRPGRVWTGDFERPGEQVTLENADQTTGVETEVAYLRLGDVHVACIPGEIYPELVYGKVEDPPDAGSDFPEAEIEPSIVDILPSDKWLLFGLANDEIGYIIPKRQWDAGPPFAYGRATAQYGEINSCGPRTAPVVMQAFANRVREITAEQALAQ